MSDTKCVPPPPPGYEYVVSAVASRHLVLAHQIFDGTNGWRTSESRKHPSLTLLLSTDKTDYHRLHVPFPQVVPSKVLVMVLLQLSVVVLFIRELPHVP